ncbi:F-box-like protein [Ceratobasidium sp. AG-Ba]|nr:F-box-like protein [Ceratobasidium sp. AG-Ba]QRW11292.1 F-box-like protein [Ceratobasidium sp. AG-Ba]
MNSCPIDGLPEEILAAIFVYINERNHYARLADGGSYDTTDYPIMFSHVCSRWRHIAINTPLLWCLIDFSTAGHKLEKLGRVKLCFSRAQNCPLHIRFGTDADGCTVADMDEGVASLLYSGSSRVESLAISYYYSRFAQQLISALFSHGQAPPVTKLALHAHSGHKRIIADPEVLSTENLGSLFSNLDSLYLDSVSPDWDRLPCRNLVELQLIELPVNGFPTSNQLIDLVRANPGLRLLKLSGFYLESSTDDAELKPVSLPLLRNLDLDLNAQFTRLILSLIVPGSKSLNMRLATWSAGQPPGFIDTFIEFSKHARITSLHLVQHGIPFSSVAQYLPHLRTLRLSRQMLLESTFAGLPESAESVPCLHTFEIDSCANGTTQNSLKNICRIPSLRRIRYRNFAFFEDGMRTSSPAVAKWFASNFERQDIEVEEFLADHSTFSSPFV